MKKIGLLLFFNTFLFNVFAQNCGLSLNSSYSNGIQTFEDLNAVCLNPGFEAKTPTPGGCYLIQTPQLINSVIKPGWNLIFDDEFDIKNNSLVFYTAENKWILNDKWIVMNDENFWVNSNQEFITIDKSFVSKDNIEFVDGKLHIKVAHNGTGDYKWTSGLIESGCDFKYGYIETRTKIHNQIGYWPQIWSYAYGADEFDWFEEINPDYYLSNAHNSLYDFTDYSNIGSNCVHAEPLIGLPNLGEKFYTAALDWSPLQATFSISNSGLNGSSYSFSRNIVGGTSDDTSPIDICADYLINSTKNIVVGSMIAPTGWIPHNANGPLTPRPSVSYMDVDYIRAYSKTDNDFEPNSIGNWIQNTNDNFDWSLGNKNSISGLSAKKGDNYLYVLGNSANNGKNAIVTQTLDLTGYKQTMLSFWYHMIGNNTLNVKINGSIMLTLTGDYGAGWNLANIDLTTYLNNNNLIITYEAITGNSGDISIDNEKVIEVYEETFETPANVGQMGAWDQKYNYNSSFDNYNYKWFPQTGTVYNQTNANGICGPAGAIDGLYYAFLNAGAWNGSICQITDNYQRECDMSQIFDLTNVNKAYLSFNYNMSDETSSSNIGDLYVFANIFDPTITPQSSLAHPGWSSYNDNNNPNNHPVLNDSYATNLFHAYLAGGNTSPNRNTWLQKTLQIPNTYMGKKVRITFYGLTKNSRSIIALDKIKLWYYDSKGNNTLKINDVITSNNSYVNIYPNPSKSIFNITYNITMSGNYKLFVTDLMGRKVKELVNEILQIGEYKIVFDASELEPGIYFCTIESVGINKTEKIVVIK